MAPAQDGASALAEIPGELSLSTQLKRALADSAKHDLDVKQEADAVPPVRQSGISS